MSEKSGKKRKLMKKKINDKKTNDKKINDKKTNDKRTNDKKADKEIKRNVAARIFLLAAPFLCGGFYEWAAGPLLGILAG